MINDYCNRLYSGKSRGNLQISNGREKFFTLQGQTNNNFDTAWYAFYQARFDNRSRLPADLRSSLGKRNFFGNVAAILDRPNKISLPFDQDIEQNDLEQIVDRTWEDSVEETIRRRLEKKFPGAYRLSDDETPQEINLEESRLRNQIWSEISIALWENNPRWQLVVRDFRTLHKAYEKAIKNFPIEDEVKRKWLDKLHKIKLTLPGQTPETANHECISTSRNAHYYPYLNSITVCAGYFNGGDQIQTLAHELAHAFDYSSRLIDFHQNSTMAKDLKALREAVCSKNSFNCDQWDKFKQSFESNLSQLKSYVGEITDFHRCLQKTKTNDEIDEPTLDEKARKFTKERFSRLATNSSFFRLTSEKLPNLSGANTPNPNYLNPCAYNLWNHLPWSLDSENNSLVFFVAAYRCDQTTTENRLRQSVDTAKSFSEELLRVVIANEGIFSSRPELQSEAISSPPTERFADRLGSFAVAEYLKKYKTPAERRTHYLASSFWLCEKPSFKTTHYEEYQALSDLIVDRAVHPESELRQKDWLSPSVREQLSCDMDFDHVECEL